MPMVETKNLKKMTREDVDGAVRSTLYRILFQLRKEGRIKIGTTNLASKSMDELRQWVVGVLFSDEEPEEKPKKPEKPQLPDESPTEEPRDDEKPVEKKTKKKKKTAAKSKKSGEEKEDKPNLEVLPEPSNPKQTDGGSQPDVLTLFVEIKNSIEKIETKIGFVEEQLHAVSEQVNKFMDFAETETVEIEEFMHNQSSSLENLDGRLASLDAFFRGEEEEEEEGEE